VLTPLEIRQLSLKRTIGIGYARQETDRVLAEIAASFEQVWQERVELARQLEAIEEKLPDVTGLERTLKNALINAERAAERIRASARQDAELALKAARQRAESLRREGEAAVARAESSARKIEDNARDEAATLLRQAADDRRSLEDEIRQIRTARLTAAREYEEELAAAAAWLREQLETAPYNEESYAR
jgi:cell division initiation protein